MIATSVLSDLTTAVSNVRSPNEVLDALDAFAARLLPVRVLGAGRMPLRASEWRAGRLGRDVFIHGSVPTGWWEEYKAMAMREYDPGVMMARSSLMAFTWTETMQMLDPVGIDRWPHELALKYGMRDALICSVGRRWIVAYWSQNVLSKQLTQPHRILLFACASFAALRLEQLVERQHGEGKQPRVTPRELAVLRLISMGRQTDEIARMLGLGEETVRSHLKKLQSKLGVRNRSHAVAEAMRLHFIP